jgi:endonuclease/exonuclease/phosphatase family metal-dependent hydrolase
MTRARDGAPGLRASSTNASRAAIMRRMTFHCRTAARISFRALLAAAIFLCGQVAADPKVAPEKRGEADAKNLRVMSFNIRNSGARDGANDWTHRKALVVATIREFDPDLLGTQEVLADQFDALHETFNDYSTAGVARDDGARKGEWSLILFRTARFDRIDAGNFWLSEHPEEVGSKSWDAALTRICSWVKLRDKVAQKELVFANTHFDHKGVVARRESARVLRERLAAIAGTDALILTGDFNTTDADPAYRVLVGENSAGASAALLADSYRELHREPMPDEGTFHAFKGGFTGSRIDWILHSPHFTALSATIMRTAAAPFPSDHYPVSAVLAYRAR